MMAVVFIALGSNIGDRMENLRRAIGELKQSRSCAIAASSSVYESEPMYVSDQPKFLNAVIKVESDLEPAELLSFLQEIEKKLGRMREKETRFGPRTIDLDILIYGTLDTKLESQDIERETQDASHKTKNLVLPHPRMFERPFVLIPLYEIEKKEWVLDAIKKLEATANPYIPPRRIAPAIS